jgi:hypothetical protein
MGVVSQASEQLGHHRSQRLDVQRLLGDDVFQPAILD